MTGRKTILITGAGGQLGSEMKVISSLYSAFNYLFVTKEELPLDDIAAVKSYFRTHPIHYCVNCAAYTAVDKAETDIERAYLINATAVGNLAMVCKEYNTQLIHISTDYVFDGTATVPYKEDNPVNPVNLYGASKLEGEVLALQNNPHTIIIRTSWVYSTFGNNFVKTMIRLMGQRECINVVSDQQGCPTYAADLAAAILHIIIHLQQTSGLGDTQVPLANIFHYSNKGITNWYEFAVAIREMTGSKCMVNPITTSQYPTPAKRPSYSVMDCTKMQQTFNLRIPEWKESLEKCLKKLSAREALQK